MKVSLAWMLGEKLLRVLNGILVGAAVARYLEPKSFGYLAVAMATVGAFSAAAGMGAENINISQLSKRTTDDQLFFSSVLLVRSLWALVVVVGAAGFMLFQSGNGIEPVYLILLTIIPLSAFSLFANAIAAHAEFKMMSILAIVGLLFGSTIRMFGVIREYDLDYFAGCMVVESLVVVLVNSMYLAKRYKLKPVIFHVDYSVMKSYFHLCLPTAISAALITIYLRLELFVVWNSLGKEAAGYWAAAMMFVTPWGMVASSILPVANQALSKKLMVPGNDYKIKLIRLIRIMLLMSIVFALINVLSVAVLAPILLGDKYASIVSIVTICSISLIPLFMGSVQEIWIAHQATTSVVLKKVLIGLPLSATFLWLGAISYGLTGIAIAMVVSYLITALLLNFILDREFLFLQLRALGIGHDRTN